MLSRVLLKSRGHKYHSSLTIHHLEVLNKFQVEDFMNILTIFLTWWSAQLWTLSYYLCVQSMASKREQYLLHIDCWVKKQKIAYMKIEGLPWWLSGKEFTCNAGDTGLIPGVRKISWRRKWQPTLVFLLGKSHGQRSLVDYSPWGCKRTGHDLVTKEQQKPKYWLTD